ncbi:MAG TPA: hypothetical protein VK820_08125 [Steroidobacteraceae bacterium]|jgi:hypothetical protein|nr:hypothetical protein [Steroidobacteraceae bacterium]
MAPENAAADIDAEAAGNAALATPPVTATCIAAAVPERVAPAILTTFAAFTGPPPHVTPPTLLPAPAASETMAPRRTGAEAVAARPSVVRTASLQSAAAPNAPGESGTDVSSQAAAWFGAWGLLSLCVPTLQAAAPNPAPTVAKPVRRRRRTGRARRCKASS